MDGTAEGTGRAARAQAVANAQTIVLADLVESLAGSSNLSLFTPILDSPQAYVHSCRVLQCSEEAGVTRVEVEVSVLQRELRRDMAALVLAGLERPLSVLVLVRAAPSDLALDLSSLPLQVEGRLSGVLKEKGLDVVGPGGARGLYAEAELDERLRGEKEALAALARENLVDVIVVGVLSIESTQTGVNTFTNRIGLSLQVVREHDAALLDVLKREVVNHSAVPEEGVRAAVEEVCELFNESLEMTVLLAGSRLPSRPYVVVEIENLGDPDRMDRVAEVIGTVFGVTEVNVLFKTDQVGRLRFLYEGPMSLVVNALRDHQFDGFSLAVTRAVGRRITYRVE